tara:strand:- start:222 stop:854 length:633 start_codon:yes stop_codon:yes gene_type:complete
MHNSNNINVAFLCSKNFTKSLEEVKEFLGFDMVFLDSLNEKKLINGEYNLLVVESNGKKTELFEKINIPKILLKKHNERNGFKNGFSKIIGLPINLIELNEVIINVSQKHQFDKNSLIKIKDYILDKNERVLKKDNKTVKITEKEIYFIEKLHTSKKPLDKDYILKYIWEYSSESDTHTIETHIYRLRQKIKNFFGDENFIKHTKRGYKL